MTLIKFCISTKLSIAIPSSMAPEELYWYSNKPITQDEEEYYHTQIEHYKKDGVFYAGTVPTCNELDTFLQENGNLILVYDSKIPYIKNSFICIDNVWVWFPQ